MARSFDQCYQEKLHLVFGAMKQLHIQGNTDEFYQIGLVALWEASLRFEEGKGEFDSYAYSYIINRMKTALTKMTNYQQRVCMTEDNILDTFDGGSFEDRVIDEIGFESYLITLTKNQQEIIRERYLYNQSQEEVSKKLGISVNAVKNRTRDALKKLRKIIKGDNV